MDNKRKPHLPCIKVHKDISSWKFWLIDTKCRTKCYKSHQMMWRLCFRILPSTAVGIISLLFLIFRSRVWKGVFDGLRCASRTLFSSLYGHWIWLMRQSKAKELTCFIDQALEGGSCSHYANPLVALPAWLAQLPGYRICTCVSKSLLSQHDYFQPK